MTFYLTSNLGLNSGGPKERERKQAPPPNGSQKMRYFVWYEMTREILQQTNFSKGITIQPSSDLFRCPFVISIRM